MGERQNLNLTQKSDSHMNDKNLYIQINLPRTTKKGIV